MSKIDLAIADAPDLAKTVTVVRRFAPEVSIANIRRSIADGVPVIECLLFENDHQAVAEKLRGLVRELPLVGAKIRVFELRPTESFDAIDPAKKEIAPQVLLNILDESDRIDAEEGVEE